MQATITDRIEKTIQLSAPRARVWKAIADAREFGLWFGVRFDGPFVAGAPLRGVITPTTADPEVAKMQEPHAGTAFEIKVDRIDPERLFSFRWHPFAIDKNVNYAAEPMTLVMFTLEHAGTGTKLTITESGFDQIPVSRRAQAFAANEGGWSKQLTLIERHLAKG